jgi:uncharacterized protein (DUF2336 family)
MAQLTAELISRLRDENSPSVRQETLALLTTEFNQPAPQPSEQQLAESIFRIMARDTGMTVRRVLAEDLKNNSAVP